MVALEAMRAGTVIVTHAIGALPSLLEIGKGAFFASEPSSSSFASQSATAINNPDECRLRAEHAFYRLKEIYSANAMANAHIKMYLSSPSKSLTHEL